MRTFSRYIDNSDLPQLVEMLSENYLNFLTEGGRSSEIQFNSELGPLLAFCEKKPLDDEFSEELSPLFTFRGEPGPGEGPKLQEVKQVGD